MKQIIALLFFTFLGYSQPQGNYPIPANFIGTYTNVSNTDTIVITEEKVIWTSNENNVEISYVADILHSDSIVFSFRCYPSVFYISLERVSRVKLIFEAQTEEGFNRRNDLYLKQIRL
jgi:hypothetical protein